MPAPKITAKFRVKGKVPFSIETFSGKIFRCGVCGHIFYSREELDKHLPSEQNEKYDGLSFPELNKNIPVNIIYTQDIRDQTNPKYPRLQKGDSLFKNNTKG
jgi:hypothetical protein